MNVDPSALFYAAPGEPPQFDLREVERIMSEHAPPPPHRSMSLMGGSGAPVAPPVVTRLEPASVEKLRRLMRSCSDKTPLLYHVGVPIFESDLFDHGTGYLIRNMGRADFVVLGVRPTGRVDNQEPPPATTAP